MAKLWTGIAGVLKVLFIIPFAILVLASILMLQVEMRLLNAETYKTALEQQQVFNRMPRIIAEQLIFTANYDPCAENPLLCETAPPEFQGCAIQALGEGRYKALTEEGENLIETDWVLLQPCLQQYPILADQSQGDGQPLFMNVLTVSDLETLIATLMPPQDLKGMADGFFDQLFRYLNGQQDQVVISLTQLKERITGQEGMDALLGIIRAQPSCTDDKMATILITVATGGTEFEMCNPPEDILALITPILQIQLGLVSEQIPDEAVILKPQDSVNAGPLDWISIRWLHFALLASPLLPLLMLAFITLFAVRTLKSWLRWWGFPFFISGLLTLGIGASLSAIFAQVWVTYLAERIPAYVSLGLLTLGHDLLVSVLHAFSEGVVVGGLTFVLVGLGMWIGSYFLKDREPKPFPTPG